MLIKVSGLPSCILLPYCLPPIPRSTTIWLDTMCTCHLSDLLALHGLIPEEFSHEIFLVFLGGLSLHLNHLIASRMTIYNWPFGTLLFGLFGSNLDTRDLKTYPRTYSGHFWNMSIFDDSRAVWVLSENGWSEKVKVFSMKERSLPPLSV